MACHALLKLASNPQHAEEIVQHGGIGAVLHLMHHSPFCATVQPVACQALKELSEEHHERIGAEDGLMRIVYALRHLDPSEDAALDALNQLLGANANNRDRFRNGPGQILNRNDRITARKLKGRKHLRDAMQQIE